MAGAGGVVWARFGAATEGLVVSGSGFATGAGARAVVGLAPGLG